MNTYFNKANSEDIDRIVALVNSAYRGDYSYQGWTTEADYLSGQRVDKQSVSELMNNGHVFLVAKDDLSTLLGCVCYNIFENQSILYFGMLTVEPTLQNKGLGKQLINELEKIAKDLKIEKLKIKVLSLRMELIEFYQRRGFLSTGEVEKFPENDPRFGIPKISGLYLNEYIKMLD